MTSNMLGPILTIREAAAWVQYRNADAVELARTPDGFASLHLYDRFPSRGSSSDLKTALLSGKVQAQGQGRDGAWQEIAPSEWLTLPLAPRDVERQHPYSAITISGVALLKVFPFKESAAARGRPAKIDWSWIRKAAAEEVTVSHTKKANVLEARYREQFPGKSASASSIRRKLAEWANSSS